MGNIIVIAIGQSRNWHTNTVKSYIINDKRKKDNVQGRSRVAHEIGLEQKLVGCRSSVELVRDWTRDRTRPSGQMGVSMQGSKHRLAEIGICLI